MTAIEIVVTSGAVAVAISAIHGFLGKILVEPMLDRKLSAQSIDLKASLVTVKAFDEYKTVDQREHDALTHSMVELRRSMDSSK